MVKSSLVAVLFLAATNAQAGLVEIKCQPNKDATTSQFIMAASLVVEDDDSISGSVQYATRATATAQTSDVRTIQVAGHLTTIEAGEIATHEVTTYHLVDENDEFVRMTLNPDLSGPISSTLMIDRKSRYSSQCRQITK